MISPQDLQGFTLRMNDEGTANGNSLVTEARHNLLSQLLQIYDVCHCRAHYLDTTGDNQMIPGLLTALLAACAPADFVEQASNKYCDTELKCVPNSQSGVLPNPDFDLQQCKDDYITQVGNLLDGCEVDWAMFNRNKKMIDEAMCNNQYNGENTYAHQMLLSPMPGGLAQYCKNEDGNGNVVPSK